MRLLPPRGPLRGIHGAGAAGRKMRSAHLGNNNLAALTLAKLGSPASATKRGMFPALFQRRRPPLGLIS
jgi:hypothetical protein